MLIKILKTSLDYPFGVLSVCLLLLFAGLVSLPSLPLDAVPDITNTQVVINTKTAGLDPEKIEMLVTRPVELEMTGISRLEELRSLSKYGLSQVTLVFKDGTDIFWARQQTFERLQNLKNKLPAHLNPEVAPMTTGLGEVFIYAVEAESNSALSKLSEVARLTELRTVQDFVIRPLIRKIPDIADVDSIGGYQKQIHINFFPDKLEKLGVTTEQLNAKLSTLGENFGGGYIQTGNKQEEQWIVRTVPGFSKIQDLESLPVGLHVNGDPILLREIADVREDHELRVGAATRNGEEAVLATVLMRMGGNSRVVANQIADEISKISLPPGVVIKPLYSRSFLVQATLWTVAKNLLEGALLVVVVLVLLLGNLKAAVFVASAIPLSMLVAGLGMLAFGISGNLMSLGAIDFGLLVDGSVVLIESIFSASSSAGKKDLHRSERKIWLLETFRPVIQPVVFGLIILLLVYLPILSLEGIEGRMFRPMAWTVIFALVGSVLVTLFVMPNLGMYLVNDRVAHETFLFQWIQNFYTPLLKNTFRRPLPWFFGCFAILAFGLFLTLGIGADFIPKLDEGDRVLTLTRSPRIGINASIEEQKRAEGIISKLGVTQEVFSRIGMPESALDPMGVNTGDTFIILKKGLAVDLKGIEAELSKGGTQEVSMTQPIEMRFNEILEGSRADISLRFLGFDTLGLMTTLERAKSLLENITGVDTLSLDSLSALRKSPMLSLSPNFEALARYGIKLSSLNEMVDRAMSGWEVGSFFEAGLRFPIVVHLDESLRNRVEAIKHIPIGIDSGGSIPLEKVANFELEDQVTTIARSWGKRYAALSIYLKGRDLASFVTEAQLVLDKSLELPAGIQSEWGGQYKNLQRAKLRLSVIVPVTLAGVFALLWLNLGSLTYALLVFLSIPFAGIGGIFALQFRSIPFSISAAVGFIALIGIALLNSLVLISVLKKTQDILAGTLSRLRPVLMTAAVAGLGFLPMAFNHGLGSEVQRPLATVVLGGLITSTLLTLFILPVSMKLLRRSS